GTVTFSTSDTDPGVVLPAPYTFQPSHGGTVTFLVTLITPGDETLTVTDTNSGITGTVVVTVTSPTAPPSARGHGPVTAMLKHWADCSTGCLVFIDPRRSGSRQRTSKPQVPRCGLSRFSCRGALLSRLEKPFAFAPPRVVSSSSPA